MDNKDLFDKIIANDSSSNAIHDELKINRMLTWGIVGILITLIVLLLIGSTISINRTLTTMSFASVHRDLDDIKAQVEAVRQQHIGLLRHCK